MTSGHLNSLFLFLHNKPTDIIIKDFEKTPTDIWL